MDSLTLLAKRAAIKDRIANAERLVSDIQSFIETDKIDKKVTLHVFRRSIDDRIITLYSQLANTYPVLLKS
jgi:hypothetical protein